MSDEILAVNDNDDDDDNEFRIWQRRVMWKRDRLRAVRSAVIDAVDAIFASNTDGEIEGPDLLFLWEHRSIFHCELGNEFAKAHANGKGILRGFLLNSMREWFWDNLRTDREPNPFFGKPVEDLLSVQKRGNRND